MSLPAWLQRSQSHPAAKVVTALKVADCVKISRRGDHVKLRNRADQTLIALMTAGHLARRDTGVGPRPSPTRPPLVALHQRASTPAPEGSCSRMGDTRFRTLALE